LTSRFSIIIHVSKEKRGEVLENIQSEFSHSTIIHIGTKKSISKFILKTQSDKTEEVIKHELEGLDGISKVNIASEGRLWPQFPKFSTLLMFSLAGFWIWIFLSIFILKETFLDSLSNGEILFIEITFALAISYWIFHIDRKAQINVIDVLANIDLATSEVKENIKDLIEKE